MKREKEEEKLQRKIHSLLEHNTADSASASAAAASAFAAAAAAAAILAQPISNFWASSNIF